MQFDTAWQPGLPIPGRRANPAYTHFSVEEKASILTWPVFAVLQLAVCLIGVCVVCWLHHRRILRENDALRAACEQAAAASEDAHAGLGAQLQARLEALTDDTAESQIQRLIIGHELEANPQFADELAALLAGSGGADTWAEVRRAEYTRVLADAQSHPNAASLLRAAFEAYADIDQLFGVECEAWPEETTEDQSEGHQEESDTSITADDVDALMSGAGDDDIEQLKAENAQLKAQVEQLQNVGDDDVRKLLKQFTLDSREMMQCIQELEKENAALKAQLGTEAAA